MIEIDDALCASLAADSVIVAMLGSAAISAQWPEENAKYSDVPTGDVDYSVLPPVDPPRARITTILISPSEDNDTPVHDDDHQIDIWSRSPRLNAALAHRVRLTLHRKPLFPDGIRVTETSCTYGPPLYEPDTRIHHQVMFCHVTWTGPA